jgi:peptide/nickel transport system ATP-binding protein
MAEPFVAIEAVTKRFALPGPFWARQQMTAVDAVTLAIARGETVGIVGESGSGKSTLLRIVLRLLRPDEGRVLIDGGDVWSLRGAGLKALRRKVQVVFQDPGASFNPRQTVRALLAAPLEVHGLGGRDDPLLAATLQRVGLDTAVLDRHPHQLSGGQKQRVGIARAIILEPELLLLDEPTSALDVSVQAQVLNLFRETRRALGLTCLFVSHNLAVVRYVADRVVVMRHGRIVETGPAAALFAEPRHDYTKALVAAVPDIGRELAQRFP